MNLLLKSPEDLPISIKKLKDYLKKEYKIEIKIDGNFVINVLDDKYDYHIYQKGKNKNTLKIYKTKNKNNIQNNLLSKYSFSDNIEQEKSIENESNNNIIKYNIEKEINLKYFHENKELKILLDSIKNNYEYLYFDFYDLVYKYKLLCDLSKNMLFNFKKINIINDVNKEQDYKNIIILNKIMSQEKIIDKLLLK